MEIIKTLKEILGLKPRWYYKEGNTLILTTIADDWHHNYTSKYQLVEGKYNKRIKPQGTLGDDLYCEKVIITPRTNLAKILVWISDGKEIKHYVVILIKNNKTIINLSYD